MNEQQLFIPNKVKVGYQTRNDTYTKQLAYVIYYDQNGTLRKEASWKSWRDTKIEANDFDNEPTEGFVLNKGVGGGKSGWNYRNEYIRVFDPRGFEFEISIANLLFILRETDCSRGKGLEGKFVYAWDKTDLVLLPTGSVDYQTCKVYTQLQGQSISLKDLKEGVTYITKKQEEWVYIGKFDYYYMLGYYYGKNRKDYEKGVVKNTRIFWDGKKYFYLKDVKKIASEKSEEIHPDYADLVDKYNRSEHGSKVIKLFLVEVSEKEYKSSKTVKYGYEWYNIWYGQNSKNEFVRYEKNKNYSDNNAYTSIYKINSNGTFSQTRDGDYYKKVNVPEQKRLLYAELENGFEIEVVPSKFEKD
jgi:hypothetical protein